MTRVIDKFGRERELRDGEWLQDGDRLVVPMIVMDRASLAIHDGMGNAAGHKPGYCFPPARTALEVARDTARAEYDARLGGAWRNSASQNSLSPVASDEDVYVSYEARLANAWRTA